MRVLIISDIHGNLPSLEYIIKVEKSVDLVISLGDVVNYGPWSNECVDFLDCLDSKVLLRGNHEVAFMSGIYLGQNTIVKTFFEVCFPLFEKRAEISNYLESFSLGNSFFIHTLNDNYIFQDTELTIDRNTFIGHSHRIFSRIVENYRLVNVGSVGQNRLNIDEINYAVWDTETEKVELVKKYYSADKLINEMKFKRYPKICIDYIMSKRNFSL